MLGGRNSQQGKVPQYKPLLRTRLHGSEDDVVNHAFYANLEELYDKCQAAHDIKFVLVDFNAKVGHLSGLVVRMDVETRQVFGAVFGGPLAVERPG